MIRTPDTTSLDFSRCRAALTAHYAALPEDQRPAFRDRLQAELVKFKADRVVELRGVELYDLLDNLGVTGPGTPTVQPEPRADDLRGMILGTTKIT